MSRKSHQTVRINGSSHGSHLGSSSNDGKGNGSSHEERLEQSRRQPDVPPPLPKINWDRASRDPNLAEALRRDGQSDDNPRHSRYDRR